MCVGGGGANTVPGERSPQKDAETWPRFSTAQFHRSPPALEDSRNWGLKVYGSVGSDESRVREKEREILCLACAPELIGDLIRK